MDPLTLLAIIGMIGAGANTASNIYQGAETDSYNQKASDFQNQMSKKQARDNQRAAIARAIGGEAHPSRYTPSPTPPDLGTARIIGGIGGLASQAAQSSTMENWLKGSANPYGTASSAYDFPEFPTA